MSGVVGPARNIFFFSFLFSSISRKQGARDLYRVSPYPWPPTICSRWQTLFGSREITTLEAEETERRVGICELGSFEAQEDLIMWEDLFFF